MIDWTRWTNPQPLPLGGPILTNAIVCLDCGLPLPFDVADRLFYDPRSGVSESAARLHEGWHDRHPQTVPVPGAVHTVNSEGQGGA